jgi:hypothetical protein
MAPDEDIEMLDRHALAMTIWLTAGVMAATLYHFGAGRGGWPFIAAAFLVVAAGFAGHVIVNAVAQRGFSARELALGLILYATTLIAFGVATLASPGFAARNFLPTSVGFMGLLAAFVFYMIARSGARQAFEAFDTIRSFSARNALNERGGRE